MIHHHFVIAFQLPAQGVGQKFLREIPGQVLRTSGNQGFEILGRAEAFPSGEFTGRFNGPAGVVAIAPAANGIEVLQSKADGIEDLVAVGTHGFGSVKLGPLSQGQLGDRFLILLFQGGDIRWGRRHFLAQYLLQHPNAAFDRTGTVGKGGRRQNTGHSEDSASIGVRQLHATHPRPGDGVFQTIDRGERPVEERVIRIHEPHDALVFAHDAFEEQASLLVHGPTHLGVHLRKILGIERLAFQAREPQPLRTKTVEQSSRSRVFEQALHL